MHNNLSLGYHNNCNEGSGQLSQECCWVFTTGSSSFGQRYLQDFIKVLYMPEGRLLHVPNSCMHAQLYARDSPVCVIVELRLY